MSKPKEVLHPWMRQEGESTPAYEAFRSYLRLRNVGKVCEDLGKSISLIGKWCAEKDWVERTRAYDNHVASAEVDQFAEELAKVRNRHLVLTEKLLDHLDTRLDQMIAANTDPTVRWTQAFVAATKAQIDAVRLREANTPTSDKLEAVLGKVAELVEAGIL